MFVLPSSLRMGAVALCLTAALSPGALAQSDDTPRRAGHVIVIGVDGMSPDGIRNADAPVMKAMMAQGAYSMHARGVLPTVSGPNWTSILTGVGPEQHGVTLNAWQGDELSLPPSVKGTGPFFPSIFQVLSDQHPDWEIGSIHDSPWIARLYDRAFVDYDVSGEGEEQTAALAVDYIKAKKPDFLFVYFGHVDHDGHQYGHGTPKYYESVARADRLIGQIQQATVDAGIAEKTVFIITSDHGGVGKSHGGESLAELEIPWIVSGAGINKGLRLDLPINTFDTPATAAWLLGAKIPYGWLGRPVRPAAVGEAMPEQLYPPNNLLLAAPVMEPRAIGSAPAGGLFLDRTARLTIQNPNETGEIRYTLDNTAPSATSPLYAGPVDITRSAVVRAAVFEDGRQASALSIGYFRLLSTSRGPRGLTWRAYLLPSGTQRLPDFTALQPVATGETIELTTDGITLPRGPDVALAFDGVIEIPTPGRYTFGLASDDGSKLYIDGKLVVDNDGPHGVLLRTGNVDLEAGKRAIRAEWFNGIGGGWLGAYIEGPGMPHQVLDPNLLTPR